MQKTLFVFALLVVGAVAQEWQALGKVVPARSFNQRAQKPVPFRVP